MRALGGSGANFAEGDKIEAKYRGGSRYYKGKITRERQNGTFDILYDDGEKETGVDSSLIRKVEGGERRFEPSAPSGSSRGGRNRVTRSGILIVLVFTMSLCVVYNARDVPAVSQDLVDIAIFVADGSLHLAGNKRISLICVIEKFSRHR